MQIRLTALLALLAVSLAAFAQPAPPAEAKVPPPTVTDAKAVKAQGRYLATITMDSGKKIELVLEGAEMPFTVANFMKLATAKFYDGLTFHRVEPAFVIQGGDPNGNGSGGPGYDIKLESNLFLSHRKGAISMARAQDPNSAGSQFFITLDDVEQLDGRYAVFGWVKTGMDVVASVKKGDVMKSVTVAPYAGKEECPILAKDEVAN